MSPSIARLIVCSLILFDENESRNRRCNQPNNCDEHRMSKLRHEGREHLPAIMRCQECQERVSDNSAGRQRHQEFSHGILHCACSEDRWNHGRWRWQQGSDGDSSKPSTPEYPVDLIKRPGRELAFERFLPAFASQPVGDVASDYRTNRRHQCVIEP